MAADNLLVFRADGLAAVTASTSTTGLRTNGVNQGTCLYARIRYKDASADTAGVNTVQFVVQHSDTDVDANYKDHVVDADQILALLATANKTKGVVYLPIATSKKYVRVRAVFTGSGANNPTIKFAAEISPTKP